MRFDEMNWMDVENYLQADDRLMLVLGACEQHGYLSLLTDARVPQALADAASRQTGVPVAPPLNFGVSNYFLSYPGTLSLRVATFLDVVEDLVRSAYGYGFRRLLVLNGHGGNDPVRGRLVELANQLDGLRLGWYSWWLAPSVAEVAARHDLPRSHANWMEAFPFTRVQDLPEGEKPPVTAGALLGARETRELAGDGSFGGPYQEPDAVMDEVFEASLGDVVRLLAFEGN